MRGGGDRAADGASCTALSGRALCGSLSGRHQTDRSPVALVTANIGVKCAASQRAATEGVRVAEPPMTAEPSAHRAPGTIGDGNEGTRGEQRSSHRAARTDDDWIGPRAS